MIDVDKDYEGDVSDEESGASQEVKSKVHGHASNHVDKLQEITKAIRTFDRWVQKLTITQLELQALYFVWGPLVEAGMGVGAILWNCLPWGSVRAGEKPGARRLLSHVIHAK